MNTNRVTSILLFFGLTTLLYTLVQYQTNLADEVADSTQKDFVVELSKREEFSTLATLIDKSGIQPLLEKAESLTFLAPTNKAFDEWRTMIGDDAYNRIINDTDQLKKILIHHMIIGKETVDTISSEDELPSLDGSLITVNKSPGQGTIRLDERATIIPLKSDIDAGNVLIQTIDAVLLPESTE